MNEGLVVAVRGIISFFTLLIFTRLLGKQQISQLNFFDYALGITIGSIAGSLTTDLSSRAWPHWVGLLTWTVLGFLVELTTLKYRYCAKVIDGEPVIIIVNGMILEKALKKSKYRIADIMSLLRNKNIFNIDDVEYAIIEPSGQLSVLKKQEQQTVTKKDLNLPASSSGLETELIYDGIIVEENLKNYNLDKKWLYKELSKRGINKVEEVFFAAINKKGELYIDKYEDHIKRIIDIGDYKGPY